MGNLRQSMTDEEWQDHCRRAEKEDVDYNLHTNAVQFGEWIKNNAEKWGEEWVLSDGKNYTTEELYKRFR